MASSTQEESRRAAEYVRMSTDHQKYSRLNQSAAIHAHAAAHGMVVVRTYADEGKSGLSIDRRDGLKQLLADIQSGSADFSAILVYDVSRWGRFQDADESGYYEFLCKRAGIDVVYCAEQFTNDGSPLSTIVKGIKRAMAGEYSRELSVKVFAGQSRLARMGFKIGGPPGYGYRRLLIDGNGIAKGILAPGEQKSISTDHVTLVPGPAGEVVIVRWIFASFVQDRKTEIEIAKALNQRGVVNSKGRAWDRNGICQILTNERYIGNYVWNQTSKKLHRKQVKNDPETWCRAEGAFEALIDRSLFDAAQRVYQFRKQRAVNGRYRKFSDDELLKHLRDLLTKHGYISRSLMRRSSVPCENTYHRRFGGLKGAFQRIGFVPQYGRRRSAFTWTGRPQGLSDDEMLQRLRSLWQEQGYLTTKIVDRNKTVPATAQYRKRFGSLRRAYTLIGFVPDPKRIRLVRPLNRRGLPDEALLEHLRSVLKERGRLSSKILRETKVGPSRGTIEYRFGSLTRAFDLIGYKPDPYETRSPRPRNVTDDQMLFALWQLWRKRGHLSQLVIVRNKDVPSHHAYVKRFGSLTRAYDLIGFKVDRHPYRRSKGKDLSERKVLQQ